MSGSNAITLRGAVQDSGGGSNWQVNAGESVRKSVVVNTHQAGLSSTQVNIVNNFDNTNSQTLTIAGAVNNFAKLGLSSYQGTGTFIGANNVYEIDLGSIVHGSGSAGGAFSFLNIGGETAYTDFLAGSFSTPKSSVLSLNGFDTFTGLAGGAARSVSFSVNSNTVGVFSETLTLNYYGYNADYTGSLGQVSFLVKGDFIATPVPEPETWGMLLVGLGVVGLRMRGLKDRAKRVYI
ncbi:MAG: PEP-CTERM sorting domain-containing protein [Pedobacter sp.]|nr:MAG: PEP-CTERM sorting domain-containing protein [Pedobacter sp.]